MMRQFIIVIGIIFSALFPQITLAQEAGFSDMAGIIQVMTPEQRASLSNNNTDQQMTPAEENQFYKLLNENNNNSSSSPITQNAPVFHASKPAVVDPDSAVVIYSHQDN